MSAAAELPLDQLDVITPDSFQNHGYPHEAWARLRRESPVHFFGDAEVPFWAITRHADITTISKQPDLFLNGPRLFVNPRAEEMQKAKMSAAQMMPIIGKLPAAIQKAWPNRAEPPRGGVEASRR